MIYFFVILAQVNLEELAPEVRLANIKERAIIRSIDDDKMEIVESEHYVYVIPKDKYSYYILSEDQNSIIYKVSAKYVGFFDRDDLDLDPKPSTYKTYPRKSRVVMLATLNLGMAFGRSEDLNSVSIKTSFDLEVANRFKVGPIMEYNSTGEDVRRVDKVSAGVTFKYLYEYSDFYIEPVFAYLIPLRKRIGEESSFNPIEVSDANITHVGMTFYYRINESDNLGLEFYYQRFSSESARYIGLNYMRGFYF